METAAGATTLSGACAASRVVHVLERVAVDRLTAGRPRARLADPDHQYFCVQRLEFVGAFEVRFQCVDKLFLDVQDAAAKLAYRVVMVAGRELVVRRSVAEVRGVDGARRGQRLQRAVDGAARKAWLRRMELGRDLVGGAVTAEPHDGVVDHRSLRGPPHSRREYLTHEGSTRSDRSAVVSSRQPSSSTTTSSSIRTPPQPGMYTPGSTVNTIPTSSFVVEPGSSDGSSCVSRPSPWPVRWKN